MTLSLSKTLVAGTPENVDDVQTMFNELVAYVNSISAIESLPGDLAAQAGSSIPSGWLLCDGAVVSRTTYATLFAAIGVVYGAGDGSTTFGLPDMRDKVLVGASGTIALGATGGAKTHTLAAGELATHRHYLNADHSIGAAGSNGNAFSHFTNGGSADNQLDMTPGTLSLKMLYTDDTGLGQAHNNMQPYVGVNWRIKT